LKMRSWSKSSHGRTREVRRPSARLRLAVLRARDRICTSVSAAAFAVLLVAAVLWNAPIAAQQADTKTANSGKPAAGETAQPTDKSIKVPVNVVNVPVTVLDKRGLPVIDLTQNEFQIFEDGKPQAIKYFFRGTRPPLRIGLVLDTSNSARRQFQFEKEAAGEFVFNMLQGRSSKNQIFLQTFDAASSIIQDFTNDPETLNEKILALKAGGGKALYDAIYFACKEKMFNSGLPADNRRVLVVVSDGQDAQSQHTLAEALSMAHKSETVVYTLGNAAYGYENEGDKVLKEIAEDTGGAALFPQGKTPGTDLDVGYLSHGQIGDTSQNKGMGASTGIYSTERLMQLADSLEHISRELTEQYNVGYSPLNDKLDGTYRSIRVVVLRRGVEVRSKPGYFATTQQ
jgi:Ca-activated chloride channel family protein